MRDDGRWAVVLGVGCGLALRDAEQRVGDVAMGRHAAHPRHRPPGYTTSFYYDELNRQKGSVDPLGSETYFVFDPVGNVTAEVNARGIPIYFLYDALNRQEEIDDALGGATYSVFDEAGNVLDTFVKLDASSVRGRSWTASPPPHPGRISDPWSPNA